MELDKKNKLFICTKTNKIRPNFKEIREYEIFNRRTNNQITRHLKKMEIDKEKYITKIKKKKIFDQIEKHMHRNLTYSPNNEVESNINKENKIKI